MRSEEGKGSVPQAQPRSESMVDVGFGDVAKELNTTLADTTQLVDEIDRKTATVPDVKLKYKPITAKSWKEYITDDANQTDTQHLHTLMNQLTNDDIIALFGARHLDVYLKLKQAYESKVESLKATNPDIKPSSAKFRKMVLELPSVISAFMKNDDLTKKTWKRLVDKTNERIKKMKEREPELLAKKQAAKLTSKPKKKFVGALLSKITPEQYRQALQEVTDAEKGKGLQKYASVTPGKMIKELERQAYAAENNGNVAKALQDPDAYKADEVSAGYKKMIKNMAKEVSKLDEEAKAADPRYSEYVKPYTEYKTAEADLINMIRQKLAKGEAKADIEKALKGEEEQE